MEYASTVWSPLPPPPPTHTHTATDIQKVGAVQRRAASWMNRDYSYTSSVTAMPKDLNCRPLDQRRIDSRLVMLYKVLYDLVAIPSSQYLTRNTRLSRNIHPLSYRQVPIRKDYYRLAFFPKVSYSLECPASRHTSPSHLGAVQQCCMSGGPCLSLNTSFCFYLLSITGDNHVTCVQLSKPDVATLSYRRSHYWWQKER